MSDGRREDTIRKGVRWEKKGCLSKDIKLNETRASLSVIKCNIASVFVVKNHVAKYFWGLFRCLCLFFFSDFDQFYDEVMDTYAKAEKSKASYWRNYWVSEREAEKAKKDDTKKDKTALKSPPICVLVLRDSLHVCLKKVPKKKKAESKNKNGYMSVMLIQHLSTVNLIDSSIKRAPSTTMRSRFTFLFLPKKIENPGVDQGLLSQTILSQTLITLIKN